MQDFHEIKEYTEDAVNLLKEMIAIPSVSFNEDEVCTHICNWLAQKNIHYKRVGCNIICEHIVSPDSPTLMLCAHIDTVSASDDYDFDPFTPDYFKAAEVIGKMTETKISEEDIIAGLGSNDDGASVVSMIAAFRYLRDNSKYSIPNLMLVLTCEEERSGKNGMTGLWDRLAEKVDYAIIGEPTGMQAATSERGLLVIDASAHGVSGHAARNEGVNAIYIAMEDIDKLRTHHFSRISPRMGEVNLNVTQIIAGTAHNVIPDNCSFVIDIRPTEQYTNEEILKELRSVCQSELNARNLSNVSSATYEGSPLAEALGRMGITSYSSPTTSDWMRIGCDAIKMGPGDSARSHRKNEFVFVKEIEEGISTYIEFIESLQI